MKELRGRNKVFENHKFFDTSLNDFARIDDALAGYACACGGLKGLCLDFTVIEWQPKLANSTLVMRRDVRNYCPDGHSPVKCVKFLKLHGPHHDVNH